MLLDGDRCRRRELLDADDFVLGVEEEHVRLAFLEPELLRRRATLGGEESDGGFVVKGDHQPVSREGVEYEVLRVFERLFHGLIPEQGRVGCEPLKHLGDGEPFGVPVLFEVCVTTFRVRGLLHRCIQVQSLVGGDLLRSGHQEGRDHAPGVLGTGEQRIAESHRELSEELVVLVAHRRAKRDALGREGAGFVRTLLHAVTVASSDHDTRGPFRNEELHRFFSL